jgi:predicted NBD/HSP70 family sugar kinase
MANRVTADGAGVILSAIRDGVARTRGDLVAYTGLARGTVGRRLDALIDAGLIIPAGDATSTGGRPSEIFEIDPSAGSLLVADVGASRARVAVCDLVGNILAEAEDPLDVADGPDRVLTELDTRWQDLLSGFRGQLPNTRGVGISVPGPVDQQTGVTVAPPIMTGWDRYPVRDVLADRYGCLAWVDNDVNAMALGEYRTVRRDHPNLLFVKVGTGVGAGLVLRGDIFRGAIGTAGDIGHMQMQGYQQRRCRCGMTGCVEAVAGGWALRQQLAEQGIEAADSRAVVDLVRGGEATAIELVRTAGRILGEAIAHTVNLINPSIVVIGGDIADAREQLLAGIREVVYQRSLPLATANLEFATSELGRRAGVVGVAHLVADALLAPKAVDRYLTDPDSWSRSPSPT